MCDECQGQRCGGKFAPFFCANVTCLQVNSFTSLYVFLLFCYFPCRVSRVNNDNNDDSVNDSDDDNDGESENYELTRAANYETPDEKTESNGAETRILICCCCSTIASTAGRRFTRDQVASSTSRW